MTQYLIVISIAFVSFILTINYSNIVDAKTDPVPLYKRQNNTNPNIIFDGEGILYFNYSYINGSYAGLQRNPVMISSLALDYYHDYIQHKDLNSLIYFVNSANWLVNNARSHYTADNKEYFVLEYKFPYMQYNLSSPWYSALAQGLALPVLCHAYEITNDTRYAISAKLILNALYVEVKDEGVTYKMPNDLGWWYEEYASPTGKHPRVLNGMIYTLEGINEYYRCSNNKDAKFLFDQGINALRNNLAKYDNDGYSFYDIFGRLAGPKYHKMHIAALERLYDITGESIFKEYSEKWKAYNGPFPY